MTDEEQELREIICRAFQDVTLGNGVGLRQGKGLDEYAGDAAIKEYRRRDEAFCWPRISSDDLNFYFGSLSFMDAEGMRFHLPAFLVASLEEKLRQDILFHLCYTSHDAESRFGLLDFEQREAVRKFLEMRLFDSRFCFQSSMIQSALDKYWNPR